MAPPPDAHSCPIELKLYRHVLYFRKSLGTRVSYICNIYIRPWPIYPFPKLIYCLYIIQRSVSEVLVPSTLQKYSIYGANVPSKQSIYRVSFLTGAPLKVLSASQQVNPELFWWYLLCNPTLFFSFHCLSQILTTTPIGFSTRLLIGILLRRNMLLKVSST